MCWNKESSLIGFLINLIGLTLHYNSPTEKFIPLFITVSLTQLFDYLVYSGYNKDLIGELLKYNFTFQLYFIQQSLNLPKEFILLPIINFIMTNQWKPYENYQCCKNNLDWNEGNYSKIYLFSLWIIIPLLYFKLYHENSNREIKFLILSGLLLLIAEKYNFGSIGKNWCMNGVILNLMTKVIYNM
jgi:hypothetical protein